MAMQTQATLAQQVEDAAKAAGLAMTGTTAGADFNGAPTTKFTLTLGERATTLELGDDFELQRDALLLGMKAYMAETAKRLKSPAPDVLLTLHGLPLRFPDSSGRSTARPRAPTPHRPRHGAPGGRDRSPAAHQDLGQHDA